jgi:hypothetical protein
VRPSVPLPRSHSSFSQTVVPIFGRQQGGALTGQGAVTLSLRSRRFSIPEPAKPVELTPRPQPHGDLFRCQLAAQLENSQVQPAQRVCTCIGFRLTGIVLMTGNDEKELARIGVKDKVQHRTPNLLRSPRLHFDRDSLANDTVIRPPAASSPKRTLQTAPPSRNASPAAPRMIALP